jgi:hypothetical protein
MTSDAVWWVGPQTDYAGKVRDLTRISVQEEKGVRGILCVVGPGRTAFVMKVYAKSVEFGWSCKGPIILQLFKVIQTSDLSDL